MGSFRKHFTLEKANAGIDLALMNPDGSPGTDTIRVRGVDSEHFQKATRNMRRNVLSWLEKHGMAARETNEYLEMSLEEQRKMQASLVMSWSFEEECTEANILELFKNAPHIAEQVDNFASKRERFANA